MKKSPFVFLILLMVGFSSCSSILSGYNSFGTTTVLSQPNFDYVKKNLTGTSSAAYILGIGGMNRTALINEAKQSLLSNYPLKSNQALSNVTVDFKNSNFVGLIYVKVLCTINADIIEFHK